MPSDRPVKATITNLDTGQSVECMFNPTEYTFAKTNNWAMSRNRGANVQNAFLSIVGASAFAIADSERTRGDRGRDFQRP